MLLRDWQEAMADDADKYDSVAAELCCDTMDVAPAREGCISLLLDPLAHRLPRCRVCRLVMRFVAAFLIAIANF